MHLICNKVLEDLYMTISTLLHISHDNQDNLCCLSEPNGFVLWGVYLQENEETQYSLGLDLAVGRAQNMFRRIFRFGVLQKKSKAR